ncbi:MAG: DUF4364 family protein [Candidatus Aphodomorpha sp.]
MPIFAKGVPKDKLTILFFTRAADLDITREQLYRAMVENDCMSYFDFQTSMAEMEEDGFIAAIPRTFGQGYRVTSRGTEALDMFEESLPYSLRMRLQAYADENRESMIRETQLVSSMEELYGGAYRVHLRVQEKTSVVLDIAFDVFSRAMAQRVRAGWQDNAEEIYLYILNKLLEEKKQPQREEEKKQLEGDQAG